MYYLMQFFPHERDKAKVTLSLSAFLFGPAYLFYRKMWKQGLLATLVMVVLSIPRLYVDHCSLFNPTFFGSLPLGWLPAAYTIGDRHLGVQGDFGHVCRAWYHDSSKAQIEEIYMACPEATAAPSCWPARRHQFAGGAALLWHHVPAAGGHPLHGRPQRDSVSYDHGGCINCPQDVEK